MCSQSTTKQLRVVVIRMEPGMICEMAFDMKGTEPSLKQILNENVDICKEIYQLASAKEFTSLRYQSHQRLPKAIC